MRIPAAALFAISLRTTFAYVPEDFAVDKKDDGGVDEDKRIRGGRRADDIDEDFKVADLCNKTAPIIICTDDEVHEADENCEYEQRGPSPDWIDTCGVKAVDCSVTLPDGTVIEDAESPWYPHCPGYQNISYPKGNSTYMCNVTDEAHTMDSCERTITVNDVTPPEITCPMDTTLDADDDCKVTFEGMAMATDNCADPPTITSDPVMLMFEGKNLDTGNTITFTADDGCGNTADCTTTVYVDDVTPPEITCPDDQTVKVNAGSCSGSWPGGNPTPSDNCDTMPDVSGGPDGPYDIYGSCSGTEDITWTVEDDCENTNECTTMLTIKDNEPPEITCPDPTTVDADDDCKATYDLNAMADDNCIPAGQISITDDRDPDYTKGYYTIGFTADDGCEHSSNDYCTAHFTVEDNTPPTVTCDEHVHLPNICDECYATYTDTVDVQDNCPGYTLYEDDDQTEFNVTGKDGDPHKLTHTATDCGGNTGMCMTLVTVLDTQAPELKCTAGEYNDTNCIFETEDNCGVKKVTCHDEWYQYWWWSAADLAAGGCDKPGCGCLANAGNHNKDDRMRRELEGEDALIPDEVQADWVPGPMKDKVTCTATDKSHLTATCITKLKPPANGGVTQVDEQP